MTSIQVPDPGGSIPGVNGVEGVVGARIAGVVVGVFGEGITGVGEGVKVAADAVGAGVNGVDAGV